MLRKSAAGLVAVAVWILTGGCGGLPGKGDASRDLHEPGPGLSGHGAARDSHDPDDRLRREQAAYDVISYDLSVELAPPSRAIDGRVVVEARAVAPLPALVLDLDPRLTVGETAVLEPGARTLVPCERRGARLRIALDPPRQPGDEVRVEVAYRGEPREAPAPPWQGGFTWAVTPGGEPWIATSCQGEGADVWWPVKDDVSDEPETMRIHITVPAPLVAASNGRLERVETLPGDRRTFHWRVSTPINAYNVALNIAPYETIESSSTSVAGDTFPVVLYFLPEDVERARKLLPEILDHLRFHEEMLGPYPFRADKYGVAQTPYLGMEHQTILAYGARFDRGAMTGGVDWGFDALHHHELSHEWWGNLVTVADWRDMWIHEGFGTYMQVLYLERKEGPERALEYLESFRGRIENARPVAPERTLSASEAYSPDIYFKGAWILHTLRYLVGDEVFFPALRRMAYSEEAAEGSRDGSACRFVTSDDFVRLVEALTGEDLGWFFEVYLRQPALPELHLDRRGDVLELRWEAPEGLPFPLPVEVRSGADTVTVEMPGGRGRLSVPADVEVEVDPGRRILRAEG